ncbi:MAG: hypothetical protein ACRDNZ_02020 [Streptosporangiaceae bacterium]
MSNLYVIDGRLRGRGDQDAAGASATDQGGGRHEADLRALSPNHRELIAAARWSLTQDPSPGYRSVLVEALRILGVDDADLGN